MPAEPPVFEPPESFNLADYLLDARIREGHGDRVALRLAERHVRYREVQVLANRFARLLQERGVRREERVMVALPDRPEFVGALFGILKLGAVVVMVNPQLGPEEIAALYRYTGARLAIVDAAERAKFEQAGQPPGGFLTVGQATGAEDAFETLEQSLAQNFETTETHRDDPAMWLFSGGTTGRPKAVVQTHRSFANTTELYAKSALGYHQDDVTISVPKLYFGYATGSNLFFPFSVGASAVLFEEHPTPEVMFEQIARHRPTILINVPKLVGRMVSHPTAAEQDLSSLRFATSAGEALPVPLYHRWKETFGVELLDGLGTAEMWHIFVSNLPGAVRPGTLGQVIPGFELDVRDDAGNPVPDGEVGRMWVRGDSRAICYWQNMPKTLEALRGEWFVGGDLIRRDADGYVTYCGRSDDVMKVGGKWLVPQEVESCLLEHPAVKECAVIGAEDAEGFTKPYAFVLATDSTKDLETELKDFALERLQAYKHPRRVILLDDFPRTHLGKIDRGKLKGMV
ncbi:MAG: benzoate-CoA ligase family protein [bacterium]|nr:benzoate-CoA ligase family protein [bacterium]